MGIISVFFFRVVAGMAFFILSFCLVFALVLKLFLFLFLEGLTTKVHKQQQQWQQRRGKRFCGLLNPPVCPCFSLSCENNWMGAFSISVWT